MGEERQPSRLVIPAKAGIRGASGFLVRSAGPIEPLVEWIPAFAGMTRAGVWLICELGGPA